MTMTGKRYLSILGSTGSIGVNALDVVSRFPDRFQVLGLAAGRNIDLLAKQTAIFRPSLVSVLNEEDAEKLRRLLPAQSGMDVVWGEEGICRVAALEGADIVVSAVVGAAGLLPTWSAVKAGKHIALANKETLVMAGALVMAEANRSGARILPVDSEHSAVFQALSGQRRQDVKRVILTASGGPFRNHSMEDLARVTRDDALNHPNWCMGAKISVDSSTLMNKGLEAIEARWLFDLAWDQIAVHIHPQSIVHSMVEYVDGSVLAQLGLPDMRVPIAYALAYPERLPLDLPFLDLPSGDNLAFHSPDETRFPCLKLAVDAGKRGGTWPVVLNAANEVAVQAFLDGEITYADIHRIVEFTLADEILGHTDVPETIEEIIRTDLVSRDKARLLIDRRKED